MPSATTKSRTASYQAFNTVDDLPQVIAMVLGIGYNVDINAQNVDSVATYTLRISNNGVNPVNTTTGRVLVWDANLLAEYSPADFASLYDATPSA